MNKKRSKKKRQDKKQKKGSGEGGGTSHQINVTRQNKKQVRGLNRDRRTS